MIVVKIGSAPAALFHTWRSYHESLRWRDARIMFVGKKSTRIGKFLHP
jgi:hypothetical protein